jgi:hypothetical protein
MSIRFAQAFILFILLLASLLALPGCVQKATYAPDGRGGYTLRTTTDSLDKAMIRFQRTAADLCTEEGSYALGEPVVIDRTPVTYGVDMTCTPP